MTDSVGPDGLLCCAHAHITQTASRHERFHAYSCGKCLADRETGPTATRVALP